MTPNSTEERVALKPCPFCGQPAEAVVFCKGQANERLGVRCSDHVCGGTVRLGDKSRDSIILWNSRATLTRTDNDVSGLSWQPIETAPKDGTVILGGYFAQPWAESHREGSVARCWYQPEFAAFVSSCREMVLASDYAFEDGSKAKLHSPVVEDVSHWMPLPAPPALAKHRQSNGGEA